MMTCGSGGGISTRNNHQFPLFDMEADTSNHRESDRDHVLSGCVQLPAMSLPGSCCSRHIVDRLAPSIHQCRTWMKPYVNRWWNNPFAGSPKMFYFAGEPSFLEDIISEERRKTSYSQNQGTILRHSVTVHKSPRTRSILSCWHSNDTVKYERCLGKINIARQIHPKPLGL